MRTQQSVRHASDFLSTVFILRLNCGLVSMMLVSAVNHKLYESVGKLLGIPANYESYNWKTDCSVTALTITRENNDKKKQ